MKDIYLTQSGVYIKFDDFKELNSKKEDYEIINFLKKKFTIKTKLIKKNFCLQTSQYHIQNGKNYKYMRLPRFGMFDLIKKSPKVYNLKNFNIVNKIKEGSDPIKPFVWKGEPKGNQKIITDYIWEYFQKNVKCGSAGLILNLDAGHGKSFIGLALIEKIQKNTIIVVHNESNLNQWVKILKLYFPDNIDQIGVYYGKKKIFRDITVCVINSVCNDTLKIVKGKEVTEVSPLEIFSKYGFTIWDETQEFCSKQSSKSFWRLQTTYMIGLSATPNERLDRFDPVSYWHIGNVLDAKTIPGYTEKDIKFKGHVSIINYLAKPIYTELILINDMISVSMMITQLLEDPDRMTLICDEINKLLEKKYNIFVFADRREYLNKIKENLIECNILSSILDNNNEDEIVRLVGGSKEADMERAEQNSKVILTTYQYMGVGKSIPKMNAIILATPRKSKSRQFINRIFRLDSNYDIERQIIDIVDYGTPMKNQLNMRLKYYEEKQYTIEYTEIDKSK